ncbi:MAG: hypothetical protein HY924_01380 [Elusimicrobia bacterium]|nr:hypothetical protein [Elusimicrobiota bacterium]
MKDIEHLLRVAAIFLVAIALFVAVRSVVKPESYGKLGRYRAAALDEIKALPVRYAGQQECGPCHKTQAREKAGSSHRGISCESCHGALAAHAAAPKTAKALKPEESSMRGFCLRCHEAAVSKPAKFPTVEGGKHNPDMACSMCHKPHSPKI